MDSASGNIDGSLADQRSVKGQVRNILAKLVAKDCTQAAMIGAKRGMIGL